MTINNVYVKMLIDPVPLVISLKLLGNYKSMVYINAMRTELYICMVRIRLISHNVLLLNFILVFIRR